MQQIKNEMILPMFENEFLILTDATCNNLFSNMDLPVKQAIMKAAFELNRAIAKHPEWPADHIHQAAIVAEESGELVRSALQHHYEGGKFQELYIEAKQTAAMGLRMMLNLTKLPTDETE